MSSICSSSRCCSATGIHLPRRRGFINAFWRTTPTRPRIKPKRSSRTSPCRSIMTRSQSGGSRWLSSTFEEEATEVAALPSVHSPEELAPSWRGTTVLCVAGRGSLDEAAAAMLVQLLEKHGIGARVVPSQAVSVANLSRLDVVGVQMAFLSYLEPGSFANPRYLVRRLRRRLPQAAIVDGFWTLTAQEADERNALAATRADLVATSLRQAVEQVVKAAKEAAGADRDTELDRETEIRAPIVAPLEAA